MSDPTLFRYRVTFPKAGRLAMLSHLELTHALERMIRRAGLPFAVTQGFSPHMKIGFGAALPVGVGSTCEIFDLYLTAYLAPSRVLDSLQAAAPPDLRPSQVVGVSAKEPAATLVFPVSFYEALIEPAEDGEWQGLKVPEVIEVVKETKVRTFPVAEYLRHVPSLSVDGEGRILIRFALEFSQNGALRPDVFLERLLEESGIAGRVLSLTRVRQSRQA